MAKGTSAAGAFSAVKLLEPFGGIVGGIMTLMQKSKCISRNFDIIDTTDQGLALFTKEQ
jgi:hypothetical protein